MGKTNFPFHHIVIDDKKEVWVLCNSSITALALVGITKRFYPTYTPHIASKEYFAELVRKNS